jgi:hypothetical protein
MYLPRVALARGLDAGGVDPLAPRRARVRKRGRDCFFGLEPSRPRGPSTPRGVLSIQIE